MKVAFVVQRYGKEVNGGSELLCRMVAERMSRYWDIDVLTSCALDYTTWEDYYPPGLQEMNGVHVRRFRVDFPRTHLLFNRISDAVFTGKKSPELEKRWVQEQGPNSSEFLRYLDTQGHQYDLFFFFTYLYGFTLFGLPKVVDRSILIPTAHDEPPFHLEIFEPLFRQAKAFLFLTPDEQEMVLKKFSLSTPSEVIGTGIDDPGEIQTEEFRKAFGERIRNPYLLYLGRIDESKGCKDLFQNFMQFRERNPAQKVQLVLAGKSVMPIPKHPDICHLGFLEDRFKHAVLKGAQVLLMPSPYESLSLVTLESWSVGTPVLVNRKCAVLEGQTRRSQGGLSYEKYEEFETNLNRLLKDSDLRTQFGKNGLEYVKAHYLWNVVEKSYQAWGDRIGRRTSQNNSNQLSSVALPST